MEHDVDIMFLTETDRKIQSEEEYSRPTFIWDDKEG